jgi:hypothetical protein
MMGQAPTGSISGVVKDLPAERDTNELSPGPLTVLVLASLAERIEPKAPLAANVMRSGRDTEQAAGGHAGTYSLEERPSGPTRPTAAFMQTKLAYRSG